MARLTLGEKAERVLGLLLGLRNPRIAEALTHHGFTNKDLEEGWNLLRRVTRTHLDAPSAPHPTPDPDTLARLDDWENHWFAIASASLARRFPEVHAWMFRNLSQTDGPAVIVSVSTFIERYDALTTAGGPPQGKAAKDLLVERGLTEVVIERARAVVKELEKVEPSPVRQAEPSPEELEKAEADLWAWYLEWSRIARATIKQRALLKGLGFLQGDQGKKGEPGEEPEAPLPAAE